jgi:hypothetical protein
MKSLKKALAVSFLAILGLSTLLLLTLILVNSQDESLLPEVKASLESSRQASEQVTDAGTRAFYYMIGLRTNGPGDDFERKGQEFWDRAKVMDVQKQLQFRGKNFRDDVWPSWNFAFPRHVNSYIEEWKARPELRAEMQKARSALEQSG